MTPTYLLNDSLTDHHIIYPDIRRIDYIFSAPPTQNPVIFDYYSVLKQYHYGQVLISSVLPPLVILAYVTSAVRLQQQQ